MSTRPRLQDILRDTASWVGGWALIFQQAGFPPFDPPSQVNETIIWVAAGLIGVPGLAQLWAARFGNGTPTAGSPAPPPSPVSSASPSGEPLPEGEAA